MDLVEFLDPDQRATLGVTAPAGGGPQPRRGRLYFNTPDSKIQCAVQVEWTRCPTLLP